MLLEDPLPILEDLVPPHSTGLKRGRKKIYKKRRCIWRQIGRIIKSIKSETSSSRMTRLLKIKHGLEVKLKQGYSSTSFQEETKITSQIKTNPKAFFAYARALQQTKSRIGPFIDTVTGRPNPDADFTAETLRKQYSSFFVTTRSAWSVPKPREFFSAERRAPGQLEDFKFTKQDIIEACEKLRNNSSPGPDGIPPQLLKVAREELATPLYILWRSSLDTCEIPPDLLLVQVSPIYKGGSRGLPRNYRPVALTSHLTKVFEHVVRKVLVQHLEDEEHLPENQHSFRAQRKNVLKI